MKAKIRSIISNLIKKVNKLENTYSAKLKIMRKVLFFLLNLMAEKDIQYEDPRNFQF